MSISNVLLGDHYSSKDIVASSSTSSPPPVRVNRTAKTTIYNVPETISRQKKSAYECSFRCFGIGRNFHKLVDGELEEHVHWHKQNCLVERNTDHSWEDYLEAMRGMKEEIEECHLERFALDSDRLIALVLNCFHILDCMLLVYEDKLTPERDRICCNYLQDLWMDMLLLENQFPFFALQEIYNMLGLHTKNSGYPPLVDLCLHFFDKFMELNCNILPPVESGSVHHLLHLVHLHLQSNPISFEDTSTAGNKASVGVIGSSAKITSFFPFTASSSDPLLVYPTPSSDTHLCSKISLLAIGDRTNALKMLE